MIIDRSSDDDDLVVTTTMTTMMMIPIVPMSKKSSFCNVEARMRQSSQSADIHDSQGDD
jgi:hypothetical protein